MFWGLLWWEPCAEVIGSDVINWSLFRCHSADSSLVSVFLRCQTWRISFQTRWLRFYSPLSFVFFFKIISTAWHVPQTVPVLKSPSPILKRSVSFPQPAGENSSQHFSMEVELRWGCPTLWLCCDCRKITALEISNQIWILAQFGKASLDPSMMCQTHDGPFAPSNSW